jgi:hypothetical protein
MNTKSEHSVCEILGQIEDILNKWESENPKKRHFSISDRESSFDGGPDGHSGMIWLHEYPE